VKGICIEVTKPFLLDSYVIPRFYRANTVKVFRVYFLAFELEIKWGELRKKEQEK